MADFYVKYGSSGAVLIAYYKCGDVNIRLHKVHSYEYVLSKSRHIVAKYENIDKALTGFHNLIYFESSMLPTFNF